jgi:DNA-binding transcriptional LysR family regulator
LDIRNMRQVLEIREQGSFAKAARALGVAQSSLSKSIARLEDELKVKLFERSPMGSELTPIGELIAERAANVIAENTQLVRDVELAVGGEVGQVRIGVGATLKHRFIARLARMIAQNHPGLRLYIELGERDRLLPELAARRLDLLICAGDHDTSDPRVVTTDVFKSKVIAVASPTHPLARVSNISVDQFRDYKSASASSRHFTNSKILGLETEDENLSFYRSNDYDGVMPLVLVGRSTLLAMFFVVKPYLESGALVRLDLRWDYDVPYVAIMTRAASSSPILSKILRYACVVGQDLQAQQDPAPIRS